MKRLIMCGLALWLACLCARGQEAVDRGDILRDLEWKSIYDAYIPDAGLIATLKNKAPEMRIDVYLGSWCSDSRDHVPVFLKILDVLDAPGLTVCLYEVGRKAAPEQKYYVEEKSVERVPTFIFYKDGAEKGRIIETPKLSILEDMLAILL
jgi:thiol-disulfide isomerase/thioredoxin